MNRRDNHTAARALAEWATKEFKRRHADALATKFDVAVSTLWNWKRALSEDPELRAIFNQYLNEMLNRDWATELNAALAEAINKMRQLIENSTDLKEVTEAFKALAEVGITREVLRSAANAEPHPSHATQSGTTTDTPNTTIN